MARPAPPLGVGVLLGVGVALGWPFGYRGQQQLSSSVTSSACVERCGGNGVARWREWCGSSGVAAAADYGRRQQRGKAGRG